MKNYKPTDLYGCKIKVVSPGYPFSNKLLMCRGFGIFDNDIIAVDYEEWAEQKDITGFYVLEPLDQLDIELLDNTNRESIIAASAAAMAMVEDILFEEPLT